MLERNTKQKHCNDPKFSDRRVWANSVDLKEQSGKGQQCLPFRLHLLDAIYGKATLFKC